MTISGTVLIVRQILSVRGIDSDVGIASQVTRNGERLITPALRSPPWTVLQDDCM